MKKRTIIILACLLCASLTSCASEPVQAPEDSKTVTVFKEIDNFGITAEKELKSERKIQLAEKQQRDAMAALLSTEGLPEVKATLTKDDGNLLVLVNKEYTVSKNYTPTDLVSIDGSLTTNQGLSMKKEAYDAYLKMLKDAKAKGFDLYICSAYRSYNTQLSLLKSSINTYGRKVALTRTAYPGRSEHHTGLAIDITSKSMGWGIKQNFTDYPDGKWLNDNCQNYGFIIRYPKGKESITGYIYEPWHLRYVGVDVAKEITSKGITFEEYLGKA